SIHPAAGCMAGTQGVVKKGRLISAFFIARCIRLLPLRMRSIGVNQHFAGMLARRFGNFDASEHAGDLFGAGMVIEQVDARYGFFFSLLFLYFEMVMRASGHLRQVRYAKNLMMSSQIA